MSKVTNFELVITENQKGGTSDIDIKDWRQVPIPSFIQIEPLLVFN
jgi:hypothetical protein